MDEVFANQEIVLGPLAVYELTIKSLRKEFKSGIEDNRAPGTISIVDFYVENITQVEWFMGYGLTPEIAFHAAIRKGFLEVVSWFLTTYAWPEPLVTTVDFMNIAAKHGQLGVIKVLHVHGCPWDYRTIKLAADGGHLECLRHLRYLRWFSQPGGSRITHSSTPMPPFSK